MKNTLKDTARQIAFIAACATLAALCGCSVTKVNYEKTDKGEVSYRLYRNDHWLKTNASGLRGGMTNDGKFEFYADGIEKSPSEEFNKMMATTMGTFAQMMQIAAAAYNPSSSGASTAAKTGNDGGGAVATQTVVNVQPAAAVTTSDAQASTNAVESVEAK